MTALKMKRPAFQFYPSDWRKDMALQSCSVAARGLWIDMLCIAHECDPYGHLTVNGRPMDAAQIARHAGISERECKKLIEELDFSGVTSRTENGAIFSRRMVRDEDIRQRRAIGGQAGAEHGVKGAEHGVKGGRPRIGRGVKKPPLEPPPSSSSSSSLLPSVEEHLLPSVGGAGSAQSADPPTPPPALSHPQPPPSFDGTNATILNCKSVVTLAKTFDIPEDWGIDAEKLGWKPSEVMREAEKFRQYWVSGKGAGTRRSVKGWRQTWSTWLGKAATDKR